MATESAGAPVIVDDTATAPIAAAQGCDACGAPVAAGAALCKDCERLSTPSRASEVTLPAAEPAPARAPVLSPSRPAIPPPAPPVAAQGGRGKGFILALVLVVVVCGALGGAAAYFAFLKEDEPARTAAADDAPLPAPSAAEPVAEPAAASDPEPAGEAEAPPAAAEEEPAASEPEPDTAALMDGSAAALLEEHYRLIDAGDYDGAWQLFHLAYRDGAGARWVDTKYDELPDLDLDSLVLEEQAVLAGDMVRVGVDLVAADTSGDGEGVCRHFVGWARVQKTGDGWVYRPGEVDGIKPGLAARAISDSDPRCQRVIG